MRYLITGGAGFIGSNIVEVLLGRGHSVRVLDNFSTGKHENINEFKDSIEIIEGDISDLKTCQTAIKGIDYVLNQAALPSVPKSIADPLFANKVNIEGTLNLLEACRFEKVKKFVTASSSAVYGEAEQLPIHEEMPTRPMSPYAITKLTNEYYCKVYNDLYDLPTVSLRYFNVFGPKQDPNGDYAPVIPKFIEAYHEKRQPTIFGDGEQSRDFIYIDNAVQANILAAESEHIRGDSYNVACGARFSLNELVSALKKLMNSDIEPKYDPPRAGDIIHSFASIEKFKKVGFEPTVQLEEGLKKTIEFFAR